MLVSRFDLDAVFAVIDAERPTLFPGVPPIYQALLDSPQGPPPRPEVDPGLHLRCDEAAAGHPGAVRADHGRAARRGLRDDRDLAGDALLLRWPGTRRPGTVGLPLTGTAARIVDPEDPSRVMPVGEAGELAISGPQVFVGYWGGDAEPTPRCSPPTAGCSPATSRRWTPDGWFSVVDRKKDLIIAGGFNIYPTEVEEVVRAIAGRGRLLRRRAARPLPRRDGEGVRRGAGRRRHRS